jgi:hypothetical protein
VARAAAGDGGCAMVPGHASPAAIAFVVAAILGRLFGLGVVRRRRRR